MPITQKQQEIELMRVQLSNEMEAYRKAVKEDLKLAIVKPLYLKAKATMKELKILMEEYEKLVTDNMIEYNQEHL